MGRYADDLVAVLDAVGVGQAVVCGLSMGGYIVFELLRRYPERVRAAVLCDTRPQADYAGGAAEPGRARGAGRRSAEPTRSASEWCRGYSLPLPWPTSRK